MSQTAPYGKWESTITPASVVQGDITPSPYSAHTSIQEYGGAAAIAHGGTVYFSNSADNRVYSIKATTETPKPVTPDKKEYRHANFTVHPARHDLLMSVLRVLSLQNQNTWFGGSESRMIARCCRGVGTSAREKAVLLMTNNLDGVESASAWMLVFACKSVAIKRRRNRAPPSYITADLYRLQPPQLSQLASVLPNIQISPPIETALFDFSLAVLTAGDMSMEMSTGPNPSDRFDPVSYDTQLLSTLGHKFTNPKALHATETLSTVYRAFLSHPDRTLQTVTLSCVLTYKPLNLGWGLVGAPFEYIVSTMNCKNVIYKRGIIYMPNCKYNQEHVISRIWETLPNAQIIGPLCVGKEEFRGIRYSTVTFGVWIFLEVTLETFGEKSDDLGMINIPAVVQIKDLRI
ncbi:hypothetical protein EV363DRAFT_1299770 [Boletus edulis]|nr:hypothetical protein EV363DRAFT_1299770 [Boletus edulis]